MARTLLDLIQQAADEIGIPQCRPLLLVKLTINQDNSLPLQIVREGFSIMANSRGGWQNLHKSIRLRLCLALLIMRFLLTLSILLQRTFWDGNMLLGSCWLYNQQEKQILKIWFCNK